MASYRVVVVVVMVAAAVVVVREARGSLKDPSDT
jgi:hypothetical protein